MELAEPFLLVGEIEGYLRQFIQRGNFTPEELNEICGLEEAKEISGVDDLTFGGYCRLLQNPESWNRINLRIDQQVFAEVLDSVRETRNNTMHFNLGDIGEDTKTLRNVSRFLDRLAHTKS